MKLNLNLQPLNTWVKTKNEPLLIAGPCSAETEDQLIATAHLLAKTGKVSVLRAGI
jgi:chorismate mutase